MNVTGQIKTQSETTSLPKLSHETSFSSLVPLYRAQIQKLEMEKVDLFSNHLEMESRFQSSVYHVSSLETRILELEGLIFNYQAEKEEGIKEKERIQFSLGADLELCQLIETIKTLNYTAASQQEEIQNWKDKDLVLNEKVGNLNALLQSVQR